jgi:hypothetical protein
MSRLTLPIGLILIVGLLLVPIASSSAQEGPDLDIKSFRVSKHINFDNVKPITIKLVVRNGGNSEGETTATVTGMQGGIDVYSKTETVSDPVGNGSTTHLFPGFIPPEAGDIEWTATFVDGDPDFDTATALTKVVSRSASTVSAIRAAKPQTGSGA